MAQATEILKKSRNISINISLDADALLKAISKERDDDVEEETEGSAVKLLRQSREEPMMVKLSQIPMAG